MFPSVDRVGMYADKALKKAFVKKGGERSGRATSGSSNERSKYVYYFDRVLLVEALVAQWIAHWTSNPGVPGSSPGRGASGLITFPASRSPLFCPAVTPRHPDTIGGRLSLRTAD